MTSANLDFVRSIFEAWERGDWGAAEWADPEIEWLIADGPDPGTWKGLAAIADAMRDQLGDWEDWRIEAEELDRRRAGARVDASQRARQEERH